MGTHKGRDGRERRIGSLLSATCAESGRNFLSPAIAHLVRREVAYQERGALIDQRRLFTNLLSSMPLAFNAFAPLRLKPELAAKVIRSLIPDIDLARVLNVGWEHSPGRLHPEFTGDRSAFDTAVVYERGDGQRGFIGFEVKYSESGSEGGQHEPNARFDQLAVASGLYRSPSSAVLRTPSLQQLFREHLLAFSALQEGGYAEARFVLIAPRHNHLVQQGARLYSAHLVEPAAGAVPFIDIELEQFIQALGWAGEMDYAAALHSRYTDWWAIDDVIEEALAAKATDFSLHRPSGNRPIALIAAATRFRVAQDTHQRRPKSCA